MTDGTNATKYNERTRLETWVFMVKWQSSVTSRFLAESEKETDALSTDIASRKEKERDLHFLPEDTILSRVVT